MDFLLSAHGLHNRLKSKLKLLDCQEIAAFDLTEPVDFSTLICSVTQSNWSIICLTMHTHPQDTSEPAI